MRESKERTEVNVWLSKKIAEQLRRVRKERGIPISQQVERAYIKSEYYDAKQN